MAKVRTIVNNQILHAQTDRINFSLYSVEEIRKLSVVKIITPLSFNALGHALPGGLYDLAMGKLLKLKTSTSINEIYDSMSLFYVFL